MSNKRTVRQRRKIRKLVDRYFADWITQEDNFYAYIFSKGGYLTSDSQLHYLFYCDTAYLKTHLTEYQLKLLNLI